MTAVSEDATADLERRIAELEQRLVSALVEREAAIERQTASALVNFRLQSELRGVAERQHASAEILRTISESSGDAERSLTEIAETTARLFGAPSVTIRIAEGDEWIKTIRVGASSQRSGAQPGSQSAAPGANLPATVYQENRQIHIPDLDNLDPSMANWPLVATRDAGARTVSGTPLRREGRAIGALIVYRDRLAAFTDQELALQQSFAEQAVIAIENARLFNETRDALERQTATSDILRVINNSSGNLAPVFDTILEKAHHLCGAPCGSLQLYQDGLVVAAATRGMTPAFDEFLRTGYPITEGMRQRLFAVLPTQQIDIVELHRAQPEEASRRAAVELGGIRTMVTVPLARDGIAFGRITAARREVEPFTEKQIALLQGFADQAAIAIENARLFNETQEALAQQKALADILSAISNSVADAKPVFEEILHSVRHLFGADNRIVFMAGQDDLLHVGAVHGPNVDDVRTLYPVPLKGTVTEKAIRERRVVTYDDVLNGRDVPDGLRAVAARLGQNYSIATAPLLAEDRAVGSLVVTRLTMKPFTEKECALLQTLADQAVIAIENTRLFNETKEALERQTATTDILKVIASSPSDVQPVFDAIVGSAARLFEPCAATITTLKDGKLHWNATVALRPDFDVDRARAVYPIPFEPGRAPSATAMLERRIIEIPDTAAPDTPELTLRAAAAGGFRSITFVPLVNQGNGIGTIILTHPQAGFRLSEKQLALVQTFADQAVIAIENARMFNETREALERQTATADILKVIASSPSNVQPVFEAIATRAKSLLGGFSSTVYRFIDGQTHLAAFTPTTPEADEVLTSNFPLAVAGFAPFEIAQAGELTQIPDAETLSGEILNISRARGFRSMLFAPLMSKGNAIGLIAVTRVLPGTFADHHEQLLKTFADQAVIAIENVRLFDEVQARTRDLSEALQQQTATADVLKVISRSVFNLQAVLDTLVESAYRLCGADLGLLYLRGDEAFECKAVAGAGFAEASELFKGRPIRAGRGTAAERVILTGEVHGITDFDEDLEFDPRVRDFLRNAEEAGSSAGRLRSTLAVPMTRDNTVVGVMVIARAQTGPFPARQIELLQTFADQAVIAIENARLFDEVQARTRELVQSLEDLRTAQDRLIQTEKLASLGQLTAGIAHEIKNPLNFVNNFAALSAELTDELKDALKPAVLDETIRAEVDELTGILKDNLGKVVQHGKRADSIVKNMLLHSRDGAGEHRPADINALVEESLNLAYHGARAEKPQFNVTLKRDFDPAAGTVEVFPQEITRVLLNLISNGFYAVAKRKADHGGAGFEPMLSATTKGGPDHVEIRIRDNGTGIPPEVKEKMFNPFFTTKPAGEGTGLGLSMSHDIIVKQHGGTVDVDTLPGEFTEFRIVLPRASHLSNKS